ncbi:MAG TPA: response regulator transcription factor [Steroidobacteraceae bacterium]
MVSVRILVASHIRLYREGLERVLGGLPEFRLVGQAGSAAEAIERTRKLGVDVALLDMTMSGAFSAAEELARDGGPGKIVALGMPEDESQVLSCARIGIAGYVMHNDSVADVVAAIKAVANGEVHCTPKIAGVVFKRIAGLSTDRASHSDRSALTAREAEVLKLIQEGMSNKMISRALGIELATVKNHVHSILVKLGIRRRAEAASLLHRSGRKTGGAIIQ